jgi:hypothetical protein
MNETMLLMEKIKKLESRLGELERREYGSGGGVTDHGALSGLADDDHPQYIKHSLATAANDFLAASGSGAFVKKTLAEVQALLGSGVTWLTAPLTSTSWDGDPHSTASKTKIDLSAVFSAPENIKAVFLKVQARDSASINTEFAYIVLGPTNTAYAGPVVCSPAGLTNDYIAQQVGWCPCDANGDIYYQILASGSGTFDVWIEIWGYMV